MRGGAVVTAALAGGCVLALAACSAQEAPTRTLSDAGRLGVEIDPHGPWSEAPQGASAPVVAAPPRSTSPAVAESTDRIAATNRGGPPAPLVSALPRSTPSAGSGPAAPAPPAPVGPPLPVPTARGSGVVAKKGAPPVKPIEAVARERFLDQPTEVRADALTLVLPPRLIGEAHLTGAEVTEAGPGRRVASGSARLTCRELTLVGERITLRTRSDGLEDVQITARGNVDFVSRRDENVLREQGLRTLLVTNDALTPLR